MRMVLSFLFISGRNKMLYFARLADVTTVVLEWIGVQSTFSSTSLIICIKISQKIQYFITTANFEKKKQKQNKTKQNKTKQKNTPSR